MGMGWYGVNIYHWDSISTMVTMGYEDIIQIVFFQHILSHNMMVKSTMSICHRDEWDLPSNSYLKRKNSQV